MIITNKRVNFAVDTNLQMNFAVNTYEGIKANSMINTNLQNVKSLVALNILYISFSALSTTANPSLKLQNTLLLAKPQ